MEGCYLTKWICLAAFPGCCTVIDGSIYDSHICHDYSGFAFDEFTSRVDCCEQGCRTVIDKEARANCVYECKRRDQPECSSECAFSDTTLEGGCKKNCKLSYCQKECLLDSEQTVCEDHCKATGYTPSQDPCSSRGLPDGADRDFCERECLRQGLSPCAAECRCLAPGQQRENCTARCDVNIGDCGDLLTALKEEVLKKEAGDRKYKHRFNRKDINRALDCANQQKDRFESNFVTRGLIYDLTHDDYKPKTIFDFYRDLLKKATM